MDVTDRVALAHDYLTQRGGAERVVLSLVKAFPGAPLHTSFYDQAGTFPEFEVADVRPLAIDRVGTLRYHHRLALPVLAPAFSRLRIDADLVMCSSSGWAHGAKARGRKVVYCHAPARWLYHTDRYLAQAGLATRIGLGVLSRPLGTWDRRAAATADRYLANSTWIAAEVARIYEREAEIVFPPVTIDVAAGQQQPDGVGPGYFLCVSRLLPYKNVEAVIRSFEHLKGERLIVVGDGPDEGRLKALAGGNVHFAGSTSDSELRWLYANTQGLVSASYEDFGLTPIEAAAFGKPTAALRFGGFLDTVRDHETGIFFDEPVAHTIAAALRHLLAESWDVEGLRRHAAFFSEERFIHRLHEIAAEELGHLALRR